MHSISLTFHITKPSTPDTVVRGRILSGCWLLAAAGTSIVQMLLLAQTWRQDQLAVRTACTASAWLIGTAAGGVVNSALRRRSAPPPASVWGAAFVGLAVAWRTWAKLPIDHSGVSPLLPDLVARTLPLLGVALLLGLLSSLWFGQQRSWAAVGERVALVRNAACLTFGLVIVWCYPSWSDPVALVCLLPLFSLDLLTSSCNPRISWMGMTGTRFAERADPARWLPLRLARQPKMATWWRTYLLHRGYAVHALLASGTAILMGAVWSAIPTPFAGVLAQTGEINKLIALLAGQGGALAVGTWLLTRCRSLVGAPDRLVPPAHQTLAWRLVWLSLALMAVSLMLLGLSQLQRPWWLGISVGIYTLAATALGVMLPRLRPSITTEVLAERHLPFGRGSVMPGFSLAYEQAIENRVNLVLGTWEGLLTAVCAPAVGLLIDHLTGGRTLIFMGLALAWFLVAVLVANPARISDQLFARPIEGRSISVMRAA